MVGRRVVHDEVSDHADAVLVRLLDEDAEVLDRSVVGVDLVEVGDVVAAVSERRRIERQQPDAVDAEPLQVVELLRSPRKSPDAVVVRVEERARVDLVEDRRLEPERLALEPVLSHAPRLLKRCQTSFDRAAGGKWGQTGFGPPHAARRSRRPHDMRLPGPSFT